jgi:transposase
VERDILMSKRARTRKSVLDQVKRGVMRLREAADELGVSYRQCKRIYARYRREGDAGLVHRSRGRPSARAKPPEVREKAVARYEERYQGMGPTLAAEKLEEKGLEIDHETLRRWLIAAGKWQRARKRGPHRTRRPRKEHFGELVQMDGSHHLWFGAEHPSACLMNLVDDATGRTLATIEVQETTEAAMRLLWKWILQYGVPKALYCDRKTVYVTEREPTVEEQLAGEEPLTQFGKACKKLGIQIITAYSPQAKGRVERNHGVYQDRFVHELRLRGITTIEGANALLEEFVPQLNEKFARPALKARDLHRRLPKNLDLRDVFCVEECRTVANDWTVRHDNRFFQIHKDNKWLPKPKQKVLVRTWLDGSVHLVFKNRKLKYEQLQEPPAKPGKPRPAKAATCPRPKAKPADNHPWRRRRVA